MPSFFCTDLNIEFARFEPLFPFPASIPPPHAVIKSSRKTCTAAAVKVIWLQLSDFLIRHLFIIPQPFKMKTLALLGFLLPMAVTAQTKADYEHVMAKFQKFYNAGQGDSIQAMSKPFIQLISKNNPLWTNERNAEALKQFGKLKSFAFLGIDKTDPDNVYVFQTFFRKAGAKTTSLTLDENSKLGTFRFMTTSDGIDDLLKNRKAGR